MLFCVCVVNIYVSLLVVVCGDFGLCTNRGAKLQLIFDMCKFFGTFFSKKFSKGGNHDGNGWFKGDFGNGENGITELWIDGITEGGN